MGSNEPGFQAAHVALNELKSTLNGILLGQERVVTELLCAAFAEGHVLLEGLPGQGKTLLARSFAGALGLELSRIQCTPDLLPADITGSEVLDGAGKLAFRPGPLIAQIVLVDEINRATPRTQSAFLEAMQERQVTWLGRRHELPSPFWLIATQNPIELEGTYPLPEAQLDRFTMKIDVPYMHRDTLHELAEVTLDPAPRPVTSPLRNLNLDLVLREVKQIVVADTLRNLAVSLTLDLQPDQSGQRGTVAHHVRYGPSPRGLQSLLRCAQVSALLTGRAHVAIEDLRTVAVSVFRHRILLKFESELDGVSADQVLASAIDRRLK